MKPAPQNGFHNFDNRHNQRFRCGEWYIARGIAWRPARVGVSFYLRWRCVQPLLDSMKGAAKMEWLKDISSSMLSLIWDLRIRMFPTLTISSPNANVGSLLYLTLALTVSAGAVQATAESVDRPLDQVRLQLKWKHQFQFAGYYAAIDQGYYRDAGLKVTLLEPPPSIEPGQQVVRGVCRIRRGILRPRGDARTWQPSGRARADLPAFASGPSGFRQLRD